MNCLENMEKGDNWNNFFVTSLLYFEAEFAHVFEFAHGKYYTVSQVGAAGVCGPPRLVWNYGDLTKIEGNK